MIMIDDDNCNDYDDNYNDYDDNHDDIYNDFDDNHEIHDDNNNFNVEIMFKDFLLQVRPKILRLRRKVEKSKL